MPFTFLQDNRAAPLSTAATSSIAYDVATTIASGLICAVGSDSTNSISTITDSLGNLWRRATRAKSSAAPAAFIDAWYAVNNSSGLDTVVITLASGSTAEYVIAEWRGTSTASGVLDTATSTINLAATAHTAGTIASTQSSNLFVVCSRLSTNQAETTGGGYTAFSSRAFFFRQWKAVTSTESTGGQFTSDVAVKSAVAFVMLRSTDFSGETPGSSLATRGFASWQRAAVHSF